MPNLRHFSLNARGDSSFPEGTLVPTFMLSGFDTITGAFSKTAVQTVSFSNLSFNPDVVLHHSFVTLWSSITCLKLFRQLATPPVLLALAELHSLKYLAVKLKLGKTVPLMCKADSPGRFLHTLECCVGSDVNVEADNFEAHFSFLLSLWPNLKDLKTPGDGPETIDY
ncbi:hypothetical protein FS749_014090 [Ceratobasidium sp. UAMH 11750]|nr:hypothetical protein FS749_014090 [Ceratobasidium sp. UAMH 11750]